MVHHRNATQTGGVLFPWWTIKTTQSVVSEAKPRKKVRISHSKIDKLACQAQSVEILTLAVKILDVIAISNNT